MVFTAHPSSATSNEPSFKTAIPTDSAVNFALSGLQAVKADSGVLRGFHCWRTNTILLSPKVQYTVPRAMLTYRSPLLVFWIRERLFIVKARSPSMIPRYIAPSATSRRELRVFSTSSGVGLTAFSHGGRSACPGQNRRRANHKIHFSLHW